MAVDISKAQSSFNLLLILAILAAVGYGVWKLFGPGGTLGADNPDNQDPTTGAYTGPVNALDNLISPQKFPGGGEGIGSSETYTGALSETLSHPLTTFGTLLGLDAAGGTTQ